MASKKYIPPVILGDLTPGGDPGGNHGDATKPGTGVGPESDAKANQILTPQEFTTPSGVLDNDLGLDGQDFGL